MATSKPAKPVTFVAALADGRTCLSFDREGEARLTLILSQGEGAKFAARLPELMDCAFGVAMQPIRD